MDSFILKLQAITECANISHSLADTEGFLLDAEGYALMQLAANGHGIGEILEVGSYMGRSASWMALGSKRTHRERITAVDHFRGSPEQQAGQDCESKVIVEEGSTFPRFMSNLRRIGVDDHVDPVVASSEEAVRNWTKPIRLLFIDGDHTYEESRRDFELWSPFVVTGGYVCFHDIGNAPGVTQYHQELLKQTKQYSHIVTVVSLSVLQKTA